MVGLSAQSQENVFYYFAPTSLVVLHCLIGFEPWNDAFGMGRLANRGEGQEGQLGGP